MVFLTIANIFGINLRFRLVSYRCPFPFDMPDYQPGGHSRGGSSAGGRGQKRQGNGGGGAPPKKGGGKGGKGGGTSDSAPAPPAGQGFRSIPGSGNLDYAACSLLCQHAKNAVKAHCWIPEAGQPNAYFQVADGERICVPPLDHGLLDNTVMQSILVKMSYLQRHMPIIALDDLRLTTVGLIRQYSTKTVCLWNELHLMITAHRASDPDYPGFRGLGLPESLVYILEGGCPGAESGMCTALAPPGPPVSRAHMDTLTIDITGSCPVPGICHVLPCCPHNHEPHQVKKTHAGPGGANPLASQAIVDLTLAHKQELATQAAQIAALHLDKDALHKQILLAQSAEWRGAAKVQGLEKALVRMKDLHSRLTDRFTGITGVAGVTDAAAFNTLPVPLASALVAMADSIMQDAGRVDSFRLDFDVAHRWVTAVGALDRCRYASLPNGMAASLEILNVAPTDDTPEEDTQPTQEWPDVVPAGQHPPPSSEVAGASTSPVVGRAVTRSGGGGMSLASPSHTLTPMHDCASPALPDTSIRAWALAVADAGPMPASRHTLCLFTLPCVLMVLFAPQFELQHLHVMSLLEPQPQAPYFSASITPLGELDFNPNCPVHRFFVVMYTALRFHTHVISDLTPRVMHGAWSPPVDPQALPETVLHDGGHSQPRVNGAMIMRRDMVRDPYGVQPISAMKRCSDPTIAASLLTDTQLLAIRDICNMYHDSGSSVNMRFPSILAHFSLWFHDTAGPRSGLDIILMSYISPLYGVPLLRPRCRTNGQPFVNSDGVPHIALVNDDHPASDTPYAMVDRANHCTGKYSTVMADPAFMGMCCPAYGDVAHCKYGAFSFLYATELFLGERPGQSPDPAMTYDLSGRVHLDRSNNRGHYIISNMRWNTVYGNSSNMVNRGYRLAKHLFGRFSRMAYKYGTHDR